MNNAVRCPFLTGIVCSCVEEGTCGGIQCVNHPLYVGNGDNQGSYCPFNNAVMCNGENCDNECYYHPDWEFVDEDDDIDYEEAMSDAYDNGYNQGFKKGYLSRMDEKNDWCECRELGFSEGIDHGYVHGYKDALLGIPSWIHDEEIEELIKQKRDNDRFHWALSL